MSSQPPDPQIPYREIVEHLPVVVYVATDDVPVARTIYMSPNVEDVLGYAPSVFLAIGQDWTSLMHPDDVAPMEARYAQTTRPSGCTKRYSMSKGSPAARVLAYRSAMGATSSGCMKEVQSSPTARNTSGP